MSAALPAERRPERLVVESNIPVLDTGMFDHMVRVAQLMASSSLVPAHLNSVRKVDGEDVSMDSKEAMANCFLVVNQAIRWKMDPFAVAQHVYVTKGRVGYEGKLIAAVINGHPAIEKRLTYAYTGEGEGRKVVVTAKMKDDPEPRSVEGTVGAWKTTGNGSPWGNLNQRDQMLSYRGAREWARRWLPEAVLGVYGDDELEFENQGRTIQGEVQREPSQPSERSSTSALKTALATGAAAATSSAPADLAPEGEPKKVTGEELAEAKKQIAEAKDGETMRLYVEGLPEHVRGHEDVTKAFHKRLGELAKAASQAGKPGTPRLKKQFVERMAKCEHLETLDVMIDETRAFVWMKEDEEALKSAYQKRKGELTPSA